MTGRKCPQRSSAPIRKDHPKPFYSSVGSRKSHHRPYNVPTATLHTKLESILYSNRRVPIATWLYEIFYITNARGRRYTGCTNTHPKPKKKKKTRVRVRVIVHDKYTYTYQVPLFVLYDPIVCICMYIFCMKLLPAFLPVSGRGYMYRYLLLTYAQS